MERQDAKEEKGSEETHYFLTHTQAKIRVLKENNLIAGSEDRDFWMFKTHDGCKLTAGSACTIKAGMECIIFAGSSCNIKTSHECNIHTSHSNIIGTANRCNIFVGDDCTIRTGENCHIDAGDDCNIDTGYECYITVGDDVVVKASWGSTIKGGKNCLVIRRDVYEVIELVEGQTIKLNSYGVKGFTVEAIEIEGKIFKPSF